MMDGPPPAVAQASRRSLRRHVTDPLYRTSYLLIAGSGTTAVLGFVFWTAAARSYSARAVGLNAALISAMALVSGACQLGLGMVLVRYVPTAGKRTRTLVIRSYALTSCLSLAIGTAVALTSSLWSPRLSFVAHDAVWVIGFALATTFWTVFTLQDFVMTGLDAPQWVPLENALHAVAKLVLLIALAVALPLAGPFLAWNLPVAFAVLAITVLIFRRLIPARRRPALAATPTTSRMIRTAAGNYAASLFSLGVIYLTPVLVADITNATKTAYFYVPWIITSVLQVIAANTSTSLTVEAALDESQLASLTRRCLIHTLRLLVPLIVLAVVASPLILAAFGHQYAAKGAPLLRLLALGVLPNAVVTIGLAVVRVQQRGLALLVTQAAEFIPLAALTAVLLPSLGITGVGVAYLGSQTLVALALLMTVFRPLLRFGADTRQA